MIIPEEEDKLGDQTVISLLLAIALVIIMVVKL